MGVSKTSEAVSKMKHGGIYFPEGMNDEENTPQQ
jgi:hypothetical protein